MLRVSNLQVSYGQVPALRGISLEIRPGELVALVGANGAGKSTTLKVLSGLLAPQSGQIEFLGDSIIGLSANAIVERGIIHVPEGRRIFPKLTVEQNLDVGAHGRRARGKEAITRDEVYALFPRLHERRRQPGGALSGGEQQMLAFGRAMMAQPLLLMLDEPSLGLAPIIVEEVARAIEHFRRSGVTVLLVEQNAELALGMASRGYVMETGRIVLSDTGKALLDDPKVWASYLGQDPNLQEDPDAHADPDARGEPVPAPAPRPAPV